MRLVDADKQLEWVDCMTPIHGIGLEPVVAVETVRDLIKGAPTIDAIPIEWLRSQLKNNPNDIESAYDNICINELIDRWQQEQETR